MAKNMVPMSGGGSGLLSKLVWLIVVAVVLVLVFKDPAGAGNTVRSAADAFVTFVSEIAS
jgi:uncharacterized membrane protein